MLYKLVLTHFVYYYLDRNPTINMLKLIETLGLRESFYIRNEMWIFIILSWGAECLHSILYLILSLFWDIYRIFEFMLYLNKITLFLNHCVG